MMSYLDLERTDWDSYLTPLLDGATDLGDAITGDVREGQADALGAYEHVRNQRQEAVKDMLDAHGLTYDVEQFYHATCGPASNIVATLPGGDAGTVYINAHSDYIAGTGAEDNASGIAVALAAVDRLRGRDLPFTVKLAVFDCEEVDAGGSRHYARTLSREEREDVLAVINLDCVGAGPDLVIPRATYDIVRGEGSVDVDADLHARLVDAAQKGGYEPVTARFSTFYADHGPFCEEGLAAATIGSAVMLDEDEVDPDFASVVHSRKDIGTSLNAAYLDRTLDIVLGTVEGLVTDVR
ncbi:MAG: M20/M25/M40 family metallo-hydrolase [Candidatus Undinarchaeales archaeon]|jgi:aminopeptidase YwaD|nr:M20/M25/M40 family metallo-hydrolase [Candidatus Undinarchaeales archaeon]MDP7492314.1 M20/M25/M40 family metallo-hydrolase [Candidatus Undinarchaeales archaeon]